MQFSSIPLHRVTLVALIFNGHENGIHSKLIRRGIFRDCDFVSQLNLEAVCACCLTDFCEVGEHGFRLKSRFARTVKMEHDLTADNHHKVISTRLLQLLERRIVNSPVGLKEAAEDSPWLQLA